MSLLDPTVKKKVDGTSAYYTIQWSPLEKVDKYTIITSVPSEAGIFELYYLDDKKKLNLMRMSRVWYGGLRSRLREITDPTLVEDENWKNILETKECYYRYSVMQSRDDMQDIVFFFAGRYAPKDTSIEHSGRYEDIYLQELSPNKIVTTG